MQYDKADQQNCPRRVVFYGRVSTELEAQISALKNQMNWYLELAEHHPNWTVVGQYADEGISGTGMKTRPSFMKMLRDARKRKFDLIVTREVSRFARNTVDTLVTTRELKQYDVEVYFVNDDIWTMRGDGEVRLTIMASLAQDESRKMSERTKAGIQTSQKKGTYVAGPTPFGYKRDKKAHTLVVQESQAETVRKIFAWYADGINGTEIAQTLTQEGTPNKSGMPQWSARQVLSITKNTIYKGYLTYNKSHIDDFLSHKSIKNSEQDYILVKGSFEPIISEELWDKCQRRRHAWQSYKDGNITQALVWKERTRRQMGLPPVLWLRSQNAGVPRRERHCSIYLLSAVAEECSPQMQRPQCASMEARIDGARNLQKRLAGSLAGYFRRIPAGTRKRSCQ